MADNGLSGFKRRLRAMPEKVKDDLRPAVTGWLEYGAALNAGRALFPSDEQFGQWVAEVVTTNLVVTPGGRYSRLGITFGFPSGLQIPTW